MGSDMSEIHRVLAYAVLAAGGAVALAGAVVKLARRSPGRAFEVASLGVLALALLQVIVGLILLAVGHRPPHGIHLLYGALVPLAMAGGVSIARQLQRDRWVIIAWACFLVALLALRAITTGTR